MAVKLSSIRKIGRFTNCESGQTVNIHKGRKAGYGVEVYYYLKSGSRVFITDREFFAVWKKVDD